MENRLITIKTTTFSKAQFIKSRLELDGIECLLKNINAIRATVPGGVKIRIKEEDLAHALRIITTIEEADRKFDDNNVSAENSIKKILVPVDFSDNSINACRFALGIALKYKAEVKIVHIYPSPALDVIPVTESHLIQVNVDVIIREIEEKVKKQMDEFMSKLNSKFADILEKGVMLTNEIYSGDPAFDLLDRADSYLPDIIILSTKTSKSKKSKSFGRFISQIAEFAKVPVLIVPVDSKYNDINAVKTIVYATNFDESDFNAIRKLMRIVKPFNFKIYCVHVGKDEKNSWEQVRVEALERYLKSSYKNIPVECSLIIGENILERLNKFAEDHDVGIIALTTHKRNILTRILNPSTTKMMMHNTDIPLLIFHS